MSSDEPVRRRRALVREIGHLEGKVRYRQRRVETDQRVIGETESRIAELRAEVDLIDQAEEGDPGA